MEINIKKQLEERNPQAKYVVVKIDHYGHLSILWKGDDYHKAPYNYGCFMDDTYNVDPEYCVVSYYRKTENGWEEFTPDHVK